MSNVLRCHELKLYLDKREVSVYKKSLAVTLTQRQHYGGYITNRGLDIAFKTLDEYTKNKVVHQLNNGHPGNLMLATLKLPGYGDITASVTPVDFTPENFSSPIVSIRFLSQGQVYLSNDVLTPAEFWQVMEEFVNG